MRKKLFHFLISGVMLAAGVTANGQTDLDAIMMGKRQLCIGPMYSYSSWKNYWKAYKRRPCWIKIKVICSELPPKMDKLALAGA